MIVASDLEGTLTTGYSWKGFASYLKAHGRGRAYTAYVASRFHQTLLYYARLIDPEGSRIAGWKGSLACSGA